MTAGPEALATDVLIIGAGPAGLTAAAELSTSTHADILVVDRESEPGGIPRHSDHLGYGIRDMHRLVSGPAYARRLADSARRSGATIRTNAMVTGWGEDGSALVTTPQGTLRITARATLLATGARERPRTARLIPGDRPRGVYTTGHLQNLVHLHHQIPGTRAVVVGAELVSWSAVVTLREAGCRTVLMTTAHPSPESYAAFNAAGKTIFRTRIATRTRVVRIIGMHRVTGVEIEDLRTKERRVINCDAVVFTGDWIPDGELARSAGIVIDPHTRGPLVDTALRTSCPGVFAAGNVLHPVDTADIAALDGRHAAAQVSRWLDADDTPSSGIRILADTPIRWASPGVVRQGDPPPPRRRLLLWSEELIRFPTVVVRQGGQLIASRRLPWPASPGRVFRVPWSILEHVNFRSGEVTVGIRASA